MYSVTIFWDIDSESRSIQCPTWGDVREAVDEDRDFASRIEIVNNETSESRMFRIDQDTLKLVRID